MEENAIKLKSIRISLTFTCWFKLVWAWRKWHIPMQNRRWEGERMGLESISSSCLEAVWSRFRSLCVWTHTCSTSGASLVSLLYTSPSQDFVLHLFVCLSLSYLLLVLRISPTLNHIPRCWMKRQRKRGSSLAFAHVSMKRRDAECLWLFQVSICLYSEEKNATTVPEKEPHAVRLQWCLVTAQCVSLQESQFQR